MFSDNFGEFPRRATGALRGCGRFFSPSTREAAAAAAAAAAGEFNRLPTVCAQVPEKKNPMEGGGGGSCTTPSIVHRNGRAGEEHTSTHKLLSHLFLFPSPLSLFQNAHIRDNIRQLKLCLNDRDILPPIYTALHRCEAAHVSESPSNPAPKSMHSPTREREFSCERSVPAAGERGNI